MKKLFTKYPLKVFLVPLIIVIFFLPNLSASKLPIPADALLGLYHPWRDNPFGNFNEYKYPVKNPIATDPIRQTYPWRLISIANIKESRLPLWNPYSFAGQPLLANVQSAPLQVLNVLYIFFSFNVAWTIQIIAQLVLVGVFMYLFLTSRGLSRLASAFGGISLAFSGFFVAWLTWGTVLAVAMWLPLVLYAITKLSQKISAVPFLMLTFSLFQTFVSGHTQTAVYVLMAAVLYSILQLKNKMGNKFTAVTFLSIIFALFLAAPQILPTLEFTSFANRQLDQAYFIGRLDWFLPIQHLVQVIAPDFFGNPTTYNYWGVWNYGEFVTYVGIAPLVLALIAIIRFNKETKFFIALLLVSVFLALENPISRLPYDLSIPLLSSFQPSRIIFLIVFSLASLSAYGFDLFFEQKNQKTTLMVSIILIGTLIFLLCLTKVTTASFPSVNSLNTSQIAFRNLVIPLILSITVAVISLMTRFKISIKSATFALLALTIIDLFRFAYKFTPFTSESIVFPNTKITEFLQSQRKPFRVMSTDRQVTDPNTLTPYKIETVSGYDPLYLRDYAVLASTWQTDKAADSGAFNRIINPENYQSPLTDLLNVKYVLTLEDINNDHFEKALEEGQTKLYENKNVNPRAFFPQVVQKVESSEEILTNLIDKNVNFLKKSYSQEMDFNNPGLIASADIYNYTDQNLSIRTSSNTQAPLFISNVFYPGWIAYVDKKKEPIKKMNFMFQSVVVPAGEHLIELKYQPSSFYTGAYIALFGLLATLTTSIAIYSTSRRRRLPTNAK